MRGQIKVFFFCLTPQLAVENASKCGICEGTSLNEGSLIIAVLMSANARVDDGRRLVVKIFIPALLPPDS